MSGSKPRNRLQPLLWVAAGLMFGLAAWFGREIGLAGVGVMFLLLGLADWLKARKVAHS